MPGTASRFIPLKRAAAYPKATGIRHLAQVLTEPISTGAPLAGVAREASLPLRTAQRWVSRYRPFVSSGLNAEVFGHLPTVHDRTDGMPIAAAPRNAGWLAMDAR
jgi:hypothetical protein